MVAGIRGAKAIDLLYRVGTEPLGLGSFDVAVLDTPPEVQGGSLPGVVLLGCKGSHRTGNGCVHSVVPRAAAEQLPTRLRQ